MNLDPGDSQIHILLKNIDFLFLPLFFFFFFFVCFPHKPAEVDEKSADLNSGQGCVLTDWRSSFPYMVVWTGKQPLATSDLFKGRRPIDQEAPVIRGSEKVESAKRKNHMSVA